MEGCPAVLHAAASTCTWPNRAPCLERVNVEGTSTLIRAALRAGVERLVHVGSANSFRPGTRAIPTCGPISYTA